MSGVTDAVLWVHHAPLMTERLGGMGILERQLFLLSSVGIKRVWIAGPEPAGAKEFRRPAGMEAAWIAHGADLPVDCRHPYLGLSGDHLVRRETLDALAAEAREGHVSYQDEERRSVVQLIGSRGERVVLFAKKPMPAGSFARLEPHGSRSAALRWLLEGARKGHDGLMARLFDRHLSLTATRWLLDTRLKPNHMTLISSAIGLWGACQFARPEHAGAVAGAALVWLHSVLDGCDGEMARLRYEESRLGGILDFWSDNVVHIALFSAMGLGLSRRTGAAWPLVLGALAAATSLAAAALAARLASARRAAGTAEPFFNGLTLDVPLSGGARILQRVEDFLTQRDFIYLLVLAALCRKEDLFLIAAGIGTPLFLLILLYLTLQTGALHGAAPKAAQTAASPRGPQ